MHRTERIRELLDSAEARLGTPMEAQALCRKALEHIAQDRRASCRAHYLLGFSSRLSGDLAEATRELLLAKKIAEGLHDAVFLARSAMQLGVLYMEQKEHKLAV